MADRIVDEVFDEAPIIPEDLEETMLFAIQEAKARLVEDGELAPLTVGHMGEMAQIDTILGDDPDQLYEAAQKMVSTYVLASAYAFVYDGYVELDEGSVDALIAEGGLAGDPAGYAICNRYYVDDEGAYEFDDELFFIGDAPNFMEDMEPVAAEEIEEVEIEEVFEEADEAE